MPPSPPRQLQAQGYGEKPYGPSPDREKVRRHLTFGLLVMFFLVLGAYVWLGLALDDVHWVRVKDILGVLFPTVTGLVCTVMVFYFGSQKG